MDEEKKNDNSLFGRDGQIGGSLLVSALVWQAATHGRLLDPGALHWAIAWLFAIGKILIGALGIMFVNSLGGFVFKGIENTFGGDKTWQKILACVVAAVVSLFAAALAGGLFR